MPKLGRRFFMKYDHFRLFLMSQSKREYKKKNKMWYFKSGTQKTILLLIHLNNKNIFTVYCYKVRKSKKVNIILSPFKQKIDILLTF